MRRQPDPGLWLGSYFRDKGLAVQSMKKKEQVPVEDTRPWRTEGHAQCPVPEGGRDHGDSHGHGEREYRSDTHYRLRVNTGRP